MKNIAIGFGAITSTRNPIAAMPKTTARCAPGRPASPTPIG